MVTRDRYQRRVRTHTMRFMSESWWEYVSRISADAARKDVAAAAQIDVSALSRWKAGDTPRAENVIALARAYGRPVDEAMIAAGYFTVEDLVDDPVVVQSSIRDVSDAELADEVSRRLAVYGDVVDEMRRRYETGDPRRIEPGSADDVFPKWSDDTDRRRRIR